MVGFEGIDGLLVGNGSGNEEGKKEGRVVPDIGVNDGIDTGARVVNVGFAEGVVIGDDDESLGIFVVRRRLGDIELNDDGIDVGMLTEGGPDKTGVGASVVLDSVGIPLIG